MRFKNHRWLVVAITLPLSIGAANAAAHFHEHQGEGDQGAATPTLNHGQKWPTDAPLPQGLDYIKSA